ncbi:MAG: type 1 glutamine amidotransferase [Desulfobulbaceae bacterium]|jgi:GMP synthase (glutamine-hydrolysing)|nr:type 1 glutamine amidotransferase [Desulfobulbaceae bacterium]
MKKIAVIQHAAWGGAGYFLIKAMLRCRVDVRVFQAWNNSFPDPDQFDGMVLMGGVANVDEVEQYPFLHLEKLWLQEVLRSWKPCFGMCLGHQLLAEALGGTIGRNFCNSVGVITGMVTSHGRAHPLFANSEPHLPLLKWHGQSVQTPVPHHFDILMTLKECQVEAFSVKGRPHLVGVQFDNHAAHAADLVQWCEHDRRWLSGIGFNQARIAAMLNQAQHEQSVFERDFILLFSNFCTML